MEQRKQAYIARFFGALPVSTKEVRKRLTSCSSMERDAWASMAIEHTLRMQKSPEQHYFRDHMTRRVFFFFMYGFIMLESFVRRLAQEIKSTDEWMAVSTNANTRGVNRPKLTWRDTVL